MNFFAKIILMVYISKTDINKNDQSSAYYWWISVLQIWALGRLEVDYFLDQKELIWTFDVGPTSPFIHKANQNWFWSLTASFRIYKN